MTARRKCVLPAFDAHGVARCSSKCSLYGDEKTTQHVGFSLTMGMCFADNTLTIPGPGMLCGPYQRGLSRVEDLRDAS